ncbi:ATP-binding cassette sub- F member 1 [Balamuthia mandrillaris]
MQSTMSTAQPKRATKGKAKAGPAKVDFAAVKKKLGGRGAGAPAASKKEEEAIAAPTDSKKKGGAGRGQGAKGKGRRRDEEEDEDHENGWEGDDHSGGEEENVKGKKKNKKKGQQEQFDANAAVAKNTGRMQAMMAEAQKAGDTKFVVKLENFALTFESQVLLQDTSLTLSFGRRYGLIGPNGTGKSTLLRNIAHRQLKGIPDDIQILYVEQEVEGTDKTPLESVIEADEERTSLLKERDELENQKKEEERQLAEGLEVEFSEEKQDRLVEVYKRLSEIGAHSAEARATAILKGLQFTDGMISSPTVELSGGWRMRIALARALFCRPHLLMLDEPTNHLDLHACVWLEHFLTKWKKTLLIVSHDVDLLNNVCTDIIHLFDKQLDHYKGNYETFEKRSAEKLRAQQKAYEKQEKMIKAAKIAKGKAAKAENTAKSKKAGKGGGGNRREASNQAKTQAMRQVKKVEEMEKIKKPPKDYQVQFLFPDPEELSHPVLQVKDVGFKYPPRTEDGGGSSSGNTPYIFKDLNLGVDLDSRIALVGRNGAGKSTLLNLLTGELEPSEGDIIRHRKLRIARFTQHFVDQLPMDITPVEYLMQLNPEYKEQDARNMLGKFGLTGKVHLQKMDTLSGGQKSRVVFSTISIKNPHILFLDEPTNHLDIQSIRALADALSKFKGGVVLVTHDQYLIGAACNRIWKVDSSSQTVVEFEGEFSDYQQELINSLDWVSDDEQQS